MSETPRTPPRLLRVRRIRDLTPHLRRVTLAGPALGALLVLVGVSSDLCGAPVAGVRPCRDLDDCRRVAAEARQGASDPDEGANVTVRAC